MQRITALRNPVEEVQSLEQQLEDVQVLLQLAREEEDGAALEEVRQELEQLQEEVERLELETLLSGPYDSYGALLTLHAGAGGTEAQDWAEMLLRMYLRWAEQREFEAEILDLLPGDEAGVKSATVLVKGQNAFGYLRGEMGVHRLVRISPFDASGRRHTSFAAVEVLPDIPADEAQVEIDSGDLRVDTFRSSGAGGQHVNKTDSAVRLTHLPTGIVVSCQNERSQHANRLSAMRILQARLFELKLREQENRLQELKGEQHEIAWGSQIRSYVFQPYKLVKDHRTGLEAGNAEAVMDGRLDPFVFAYLRQEVSARA